MNVAIIPARGGSKRIPRKNIKTFYGKPLIAYSIEAASRSKLFDRIIVSTDSAEIAETAKHYGAESPFLRPAELADDFSPTVDVILHALDWLADHGTTVEYACCIYATAPFIQPEFLQEGYELIEQSKATTVFSVTSYTASPFRALTIAPDGRLAMLWPEYELARSNDLPDAFQDAGQFYWLNARRFVIEKRIYSADSRPVVLPRYMVQDIDTPEDWLTAEVMYEALRSLGKIKPKDPLP